MSAKRRLLCVPVLLIAACSATLEGSSDCQDLTMCVVDAAMAPMRDLAMRDLAAPVRDMATPPPPPDLAIPVLNLHQVTVFNNPPDVADWPVTTMITRVDIKPSGVHLVF